MHKSLTLYEWNTKINHVEKRKLLAMVLNDEEGCFNTLLIFDFHVIFLHSCHKPFIKYSLIFSFTQIITINVSIARSGVCEEETSD